MPQFQRISQQLIRSTFYHSSLDTIHHPSDDLSSLCRNHDRKYEACKKPARAQENCMKNAIERWQSKRSCVQCRQCPTTSKRHKDWLELTPTTKAKHRQRGERGIITISSKTIVHWCGISHCCCLSLINQKNYYASLETRHMKEA
jgi:hypothetical protein